MGGIHNRVLGLVCTIFANYCDNTFPSPEIPDSNVYPSPSSSLIISTQSGLLNGYYMKTITGQLIKVYEGVPYAEPPMGELRFRNPVKKSPWTGIRNSTRPNHCLQMDPSKFYRVVGDEDCLFLNVYVPSGRLKNSNFPVMIWIHGGSFFWGSGINQGPAYLLDHDIILVTINYRLGPLGFFSTADGVGSPGNYGLKDQSLALDWVVENIGSFGGDKNRITLAGHSAGAVCVHLHLMSSKSKHKFQRAISESGSALSHWGVPPNQIQYSEKLAISLGCSTRGNSAKLMECMRRRNANRIVSKQFNILNSLDNPLLLFGPVIEKNGSDAFLTQSPEDYYKNGLVADTPWITGINRDEGDLFSLANYLGPGSTRKLLKNYKFTFPELLMYDKSKVEVTDKIKDFYLGKDTKFSYSGHETLEDLSQMLGDRFFYAPFYKTVQFHSSLKQSPLYAYYFSYKGKFTASEKFHVPSSEFGVLHMDEIQYLFNKSGFYPPLKVTDRDYLISKYFTELWTNFATFGEPVTKTNNQIQHIWAPYTLNSSKLLDINFNSGMINEPNQNRSSFWNSLSLN